ncbi:biotin/lipoyl-binding protein [Carboxylicivirga sediminis]|uniref:Biotin/lipoyl-binding protein n=1 Tax=Carboxylicivirga sediminis TaxID=2006564 RepID=A0A941F2P1_9BACT|nr:biotin carboxylase N-terminal domain-containing protein [Carboxylicivirga sediminis]MBR8535194.1 biotin/lipoyl-binding protein [Carboxylicivirga sediminis]
MMRKVLIPNRGEIAARIIRAAHQLGLKTVVTLSELEKDTLPAQLSDEVHLFADGPFEENYLNIEGIIDIARQYKADCIHPGYGFLSENQHLAEACQKADITFVGPSANNLKLMGDKQVARSIAQQANVSLTKSWEGSLQTILAEADALPYPVLVKAAMGGGGKGMQICHNKNELLEHLPILSKQALRYFGDERLYVEQYIQKARHIEVQVLADKHGNKVHLFDRECSVQRRFQKIIEEAPAAHLSDDIKQRLYNDALRLCRSINYTNAGTIEFLVDDEGQHYFLEMNTRIQVEHCVTEEITGVDLVQWQFKIANGLTLDFNQNDLAINGHAIELRVCAEDVTNNFRPSPGVIKNLLLPDPNSARLEIGFNQPGEIHSQFDPMIAKLVVHAKDRATSIQKAIHANDNLIIQGISTNAGFLNTLLQHQAFTDSSLHTRFCDEHLAELLKTTADNDDLISLAYTAYRILRQQGHFWRQLPLFTFSINENRYLSEVNLIDNDLNIQLNQEFFQLKNCILDNHQLNFQLDREDYHFYCFEEADNVLINHHQQWVSIKAHDWLPDYHPESNGETTLNGDHYLAPIPSQVMKVHVDEGQEVKKGDLLLVLEAMKTENHIKAWKDGIIDKVHISAGQQVKFNQNLLAYKADE